MYGRGISEAMTAFAVALLVIGILIGAALFIGVPWLWSLLKPFIHALTA